MKSPAFRRRKIITFVKKAMQSYKSGSHTRYDVKYHIVWITKYRRPIMVGPVAERLRELIRQICQQNEVTIIKGHISKDHLHLLVSCSPSLAGKPFSSKTQRSDISQAVPGIRTLASAVLGTAFMGSRLLCGYYRYGN